MKEEIVTFGSDRSLVGVITVPDDGVQLASRPAFVLSNSGVVHRVGPNRIYVKIARELASLGHLVLRFDLSGIGDSKARLDNIPYPRSAVAETREAMDYLATSFGVQQFIVAGICSGAGIALQTAHCDARVCGVAAINNPGQVGADAKTLNKMLTRHFLRIMFRSSYTSKNWIKVATLQFDVPRVAQSIGGRLIGLFRPRTTRSEPSVPKTNHAEEQIPTDCDVRVLHVHSEGDEGLDYFTMVLQPKIKQLNAADQKRFRLEIIPRANHTFTLLSNQQRLIDALRRWTHDEFGSPRVSREQVGV